MNEATEYRFRTKTGNCVVTPEKLEITREDMVGGASEAVFGTSIIRALFVYGLLGFIVLLIGVIFLFKGSYFSGILLSVIGLIFFLNVFRSLNNSATNIIERSEVRLIKFHSPHPPFTRGYLEILFVRDGKTRKRLLFLPGSLSEGNKEYKKALTVMQESGWYT